MTIKLESLVLLAILVVTSFNAWSLYKVQETLAKPFQVQIDVPFLPSDVGPPVDPCPLEPDDFLVSC
jgi:hypothetical protein